MTAKIGIKTANGEFYPILDEGSQTKKRLVLTTVHDEQEIVQIDLYRNFGESLDTAEYIGTLDVETVNREKQGEASVELIISLDQKGTLIAKARDLNNPDPSNVSTMAVSLNSLEFIAPEESVKELELEDNKPETTYLEDEEEYFSSYHIASNNKTEKTRFFIIVGVVILLAAAFCVWFFAFNGKKTILPPYIEAKTGAREVNAPKKPPTEAAPPVSRPPAAPAIPITEEKPALENTAPAGNTQPAQEQEPAESMPPEQAEEPAESMPSEQAEEPAESMPPPSMPPSPQPEKNQPQPLAKAETAKLVKTDQVKPSPEKTTETPENTTTNEEIIIHKSIWGDTLSSISKKYYNTSKYYKFLADYNGIKDPDKIISGTTIRIPPKPR